MSDSNSTGRMVALLSIILHADPLWQSLLPLPESSSFWPRLEGADLGDLPGTGTLRSQCCLHPLCRMACAHGSYMCAGTAQVLGIAAGIPAKGFVADD